MKTEKAAKIAVIEDDLGVQEMLKAFFAGKGYDVQLFSNAESMLAQAKLSPKLNESCDVALIDFNLPGISGIELLAKLKKIWPETPIILMTGTGSSEVALEAVEKGAYDFLVKPIYFPQLLVSIERALHLTKLSKNLHTLKDLVTGQRLQSLRGIVSKSTSFLADLDIAKRVAGSNANIFITGESGTGKEVIAKFIHRESKQKDGPFIAINCSAIPESLLESELFGHAKGAFTNATESKLGLFEEAENGTLFLDEIGDMPIALQAKILRVLQEKEIVRIGETRPRSVNARIVSSTHKNLSEAIVAGEFREDLYFRLNVIPIHLAPLRERKEDILPLAEYFLAKFAAINQIPTPNLSREAVEVLLTHSWPGNVRELENTMERATVLCSGETLTPADLISPLLNQFGALSTERMLRNDSDFFVRVEGSLPRLEEIVQKYIEFAVRKNSGAKDRTARELGIDRKTLYKKLASREQDSI